MFAEMGRVRWCTGQGIRSACLPGCQLQGAVWWQTQVAQVLHVAQAVYLPSCPAVHHHPAPPRLLPAAVVQPVLEHFWAPVLSHCFTTHDNWHSGPCTGMAAVSGLVVVRL